MAERQIALLRGINVGKAKRVKMADLRAVLEGAGFTDVRTLLQSGNVVCTGRGSPQALAAKMEKACLAGVGFSYRVTVRPATGLDAILAANPFPDAVAEPSRYLIAILADASVRERVVPLTKQEWGADRIALGERVAYCWHQGGILESALPAALGKAVGDRVTARNWATLVKLQALAHATDR